jgi:hypothetical protein
MEDDAITLIADLLCLHCGHVSGRIEFERSPKRVVLTAYISNKGLRSNAPKFVSSLRCAKCKAAAVIADDIRKPTKKGEPVRARDLPPGTA